jgi:SAM-dependent methyltransferase
MAMMCEGHLGGYFAGGDPATHCPHFWSWLVSRLQVRSMLDVGCGEGWAVKYFAELGCDAAGVDGSSTAVENTVACGRVACHDLCTGPYLPGRTYDLVWSSEFVEHIEEAYLAHVLGTLNLAERYLVLTHAFPGQKGHHHVNCQTSAYWIALIEGLGFRFEYALTLQARRITRRDYFGVNHFARSGLIFSRRAPTSAGKMWLLRGDLACVGRNPSWRARCLDAALWSNFKLAKIGHKLSKRLRRAAE